MNLKSEFSSQEWDGLLATIGGHPLQSALWGEAKKSVYAVTDQRLAIYDQDKIIALIRIENKGLKSVLKVGWIPQGIDEVKNPGVADFKKKMGG